MPMTHMLLRRERTMIMVLLFDNGADLCLHTLDTHASPTRATGQLRRPDSVVLLLSTPGRFLTAFCKSKSFTSVLELKS